MKKRIICVLLCVLTLSALLCTAVMPALAAEETTAQTEATEDSAQTQGVMIKHRLPKKTLQKILHNLLQFFKPNKQKNRKKRSITTTREKHSSSKTQRLHKKAEIIISFPLLLQTNVMQQ